MAKKRGEIKDKPLDINERARLKNSKTRTGDSRWNGRS
jgi:hypothetical protein